MRTVQLTLDEELVEEVDRLVSELRTSRSAFTREALRHALDRRRSELREERHRDGYERLPVDPGEIRSWEEEQVWPD
jgi:metal-responsive CopG/Arc/MetJ family transcriptional regulator